MKPIRRVEHAFGALLDVQTQLEIHGHLKDLPQAKAAALAQECKQAVTLLQRTIARATRVLEEGVEDTA